MVDVSELDNPFARTSWSTYARASAKVAGQTSWGWS